MTSSSVEIGTKCRTVVPSDSTVVACSALYVGTTGDVAILAADDSAAVTFSSVPAGSIIPVACQKVMSTNTTASNIVAIYA